MSPAVARGLSTAISETLERAAAQERAVADRLARAELAGRHIEAGMLRELHDAIAGSSQQYRAELNRLSAQKRLI